MYGDLHPAEYLAAPGIVPAGIGSAKREGFDHLKINCVLIRGFKNNQITPFG